MEVLRYSAFTTDPAGGNPAGVVLDAGDLDEAAMLATAAEVGFSETAFLRPAGDGYMDARYFSPLIEVPFCGHATIASAVAYATRHGVGDLVFRTKAGLVPVTTAVDSDGMVVATLTSVPPRVAPIPAEDLARLLECLRWELESLDRSLPPRSAYAGAWHPIIAVTTRERLARLDYDTAALTDLMRARDWATVDLVWRESETVFHCRNPFPVGGVYEDPATGAAAAALGGYLRELRLVPLPSSVTVIQGVDMGRPGRISVAIPTELGTGISISGTAVQM